MTRKMKLALIVPAAILLLPVLAFFLLQLNREAAAVFAANRLLSAYGVEVVSITGLNLRTDNLAVETIRFRYIGEDSQIMKLENLQVAFEAEQLLAGRADSITLDRAVLFLPPTTEKATAHNADQNSPALPSHQQLTDLKQTLQAIPVQYLHIKQLTLAPYLTQAEFSLSAESDSMTAELFDNALHALLTANWSGPEFGQLSINLTEGVESLAALEADLQLNSDELQILSSIHTSPALQSLISSRLKEHLPAQPLPVIRQDLDFTVNAGLPLSTDNNEDKVTLTATIQIPGGQTLSADGLTPWLPEIDLPTLNLELLTPLIAELTYPLQGAEPQLQLTSASLTVLAPLIIYERSISSLDLQLENLTLTLAPTIELQTDFASTRLASELFPYDLSSASIAGHVRADQQAFSLQAETTLNGQLLVHADLEHDLLQQQGQGDFEVPGIVFDSLWSKLSDFIKPMPLQADILDGTLAGSARLHWQLPATDAALQLRGEADISMTQLSGFYEETAFVGLTTATTLNILPGYLLQTSRPSSLHLDSVDPGVPVTDLNATYSVDMQSGRLSAEEVSAHIFGGTVSSPGFTLNMNTLTATLPLTLNRIDLSRIMTLTAYEGVNASGVVSGELPISISNGKPLVSGGHLSAHPPGGVIYYRPDGSGATGNSSLDLVYQALSNYQYDTLSAEVDYQEDGELTLAVTLQGLNPDMRGGQRINLNLNITDNIPALLQSLQSGRTIAEELVRELETR